LVGWLSLDRFICDSLEISFRKLGLAEGTSLGDILLLDNLGL
jgi:hypothetical protein